MPKHRLTSPHSIRLWEDQLARLKARALTSGERPWNLSQQIRQILDHYFRATQTNK